MAFRRDEVHEKNTLPCFLPVVLVMLKQQPTYVVENTRICENNC